MKPIITKLFFFAFFTMLFFSCETECKHDKENHEEVNSKRPSQAITYPEMASMFKEYDNGQRIVLNNYITKKSEGKDTVATISQFFNISEIKQYIAYIERLSAEKEIPLTGIRIFTSAYPSDYKIPEYRNRVSFILAPTTTIDGRNVAYEPLESKMKSPVTMQSILDEYADTTTKTVNRASFLSFENLYAGNSSALNRGTTTPPF